MNASQQTCWVHGTSRSKNIADQTFTRGLTTTRVLSKVKHANCTRSRCTRIFDSRTCMLQSRAVCGPDLLTSAVMASLKGPWKVLRIRLYSHAAGVWLVLTEIAPKLTSAGSWLMIIAWPAPSACGISLYCTEPSSKRTSAWPLPLTFGKEVL